ncbi:NtaA/DmoA family FMN-dependent monooxygenase [Streptomyces sp. NPDC059582]|uniref:NtaA/DmoA family FMN-dependent monooxygenase n=1 Tax=Streptomyces sp. NPDC059582 TaxID=3346875 RepID=UPI00369273DA
MQSRRRLVLFLFVVPTGHHEASWRLPHSPAERMYDVDYYVGLARAAELAGIDAVFFADAPALRTRVEHNTGGSVLEPFTLLSALASVTTTLGLIGTASTTYAEPYNVARLVSSLDHLSRGRAGWNVVTTSFAGAAANFGAGAHPDRLTRYARAEEFLQVVKGLWDSWASHAIRCDRAAGVYVDRSLIRPIDHDGEDFHVAGPFQSARSPQGHPLIVQAGASEPGRAFAARHADVVFSVQRDRDRATRFRAGLRAAASAAGRRPEALLSLPGLSVHVASTAAEARNKQEELDELVIPEHGIGQIRAVTGVDLSGFGLDEVIDHDALRDRHGPTAMTRADEILAMVEEGPCTVRGLVRRVAGARTHRVVVGPPEAVADTMETWFRSGACDGFNLLPPALPGGLHDFVEFVLPELARRGIWRRSQGMLRERLELPAVS